MLRLNAKRNKKGNTNISHFPMKCKLAAALNLNQLEQGSERDRRSSRHRAGLRDKPQTSHVQPGLRGSSNAIPSALLMRSWLGGPAPLRSPRSSPQPRWWDADGGKRRRGGSEGLRFPEKHETSLRPLTRPHLQKPRLFL
ncbi:uncharacterized protein ACIBXB_019949 [Morphnus guianensis]